jgi:hypothetical protein
MEHFSGLARIYLPPLGQEVTMGVEKMADKIREDLAARIVQELNRRAKERISFIELQTVGREINMLVAERLAGALDAQRDVVHRIGYRPASYQLVSTQHVRDAAEELLAAAKSVQQLLIRHGLEEHTAGRELAVVIEKASAVDAQDGADLVAGQIQPIDRSGLVMELARAALRALKNVLGIED